MMRTEIAAIAAVAVLAISTGALAFEYQQQQSMIDAQSAQLANGSREISNLTTILRNLTSILNGHGTELLFNSSSFVVGPATQSQLYGGVLKVLGNFTFPHGGYLVLSIVSSNFTGQDDFHVWTDWKGQGGRVPVEWELHPGGWQYICGDTPIPCVTPATTLDLPARIVFPVTAGSSLSISVQNQDPSALLMSVSVRYEH